MMNGAPRADVANDALLRRLGSIANDVDPVPEVAYRMGYAAFALRSLDSELAELVDDSALQPDGLAGVRGDVDVRMLYYQASEVGVELHVTRTSPGRHTVLGQVIGATTTEVQVTEVQVQVESESESPGRLATVPIDDLGRFDVDDLPAGRFRVRLVGPHRPRVTTAWTLV